MGTVISIWLLQWGVVIVIALASADTSGFGKRLVAAIMRPSIGIYATGCLAFMFAGAHAASTYDFAGAAMAGTSFWIEVALMVITIVAGLFRRFGGGPDFTFGSARFATGEDCVSYGLFGSKGIRLGYLRTPGGRRIAPAQPLHYTGQRHLLTVAPTRAGKGVASIIPNLLTYGSSVLVVDPKGENARVTYSRRAQTGRAYALDPWGLSGTKTARFNPLDMLAPNSPTLIEDATLIAEALVIPETQGNGKHFSEQAADLIKGFLLHLAIEPGEDRTLGRLRTILTMPPKELAAVGIAMSKSPHPIVKAAAAQFITKSEVERLGVLSTAQRNTHFLDSPALRDNLAASDFRFADLKGPVPVTVYLILPVDRLTSHNRWLRLLIAQAIGELARTPMKAKLPVLCVLDEFAQLGRLPIVEDAFGLMAGMGMMLHIIAQDLAQLRRIYGEGWQTFAANAGVLQFFGTRDIFTAEYVSKLIGVTTTTARSTSTNQGSSRSYGGQGGGSSGTSSGSSVSWAPTQRPLLFPDELMRMDRDAQVLFVENAPPVLADKITWFRDAAYQQLGTADRGAPVLEPAGPAYDAVRLPKPVADAVPADAQVPV